MFEGKTFKEFFEIFDKVIEFNDFLGFGHDEYINYIELFSGIFQYQEFVQNEELGFYEFNERYSKFKEWIQNKQLLDTKLDIFDEEKKMKEIIQKFKNIRDRLRNYMWKCMHQARKENKIKNIKN